MRKRLNFLNSRIMCCLLLLIAFTSSIILVCVRKRILFRIPENVFDESGSAKQELDEDPTEDYTANFEVAFNMRDYPNFPAQFFADASKKPPKPLKKSCAVFPSLETIHFNNLYWQTLETSKGEYQLLGAYWDIRAKNKNKPTVRILAMITPLSAEEKLYCQFWFRDKVVVSEKIWTYFLWRKSWGGNTESNYKPYLLNCKLPKEYMDKPPLAVSLVRRSCDQATNLLKINVNIPDEKDTFAVCVKGLDFHDDVSIRLIEWIEYLKVLGAKKIFFYELHVHEEIRKILDYYENEDMTVETTPTSLPGYYPNQPYLQHLFLSKYRTKKRLYELISYNDCFMKHMYEYQYILLLDIDEVIVPRNGSWNELFDDILSNPAAREKSSYNARNVYFFDDYVTKEMYFKDIPPYMHMLQHIYRTSKVMGSGLYIKSFHNTDLVLALHNHYPLYCIEPCKNSEINPEKAVLHHYRKTCVKEIKNCEAMKKEKMKDLTIWKHKRELIESVEAVMDVLDIHR